MTRPMSFDKPADPAVVKQPNPNNPGNREVPHNKFCVIDQL